MPTKSQSSVPKKGGIHIGDVGGNVDFHALGDIVGGDKIVTINTTIQIAVEAVTQRPLITASPYRGLDHFVDRDKDLFFGRDQLIRSLLSQLGSNKPLLVLGASGSGKSSVVRAGLLPALSRLLGASFRSFTLVPDVNPFESLRSSFQRDFSQAETRPITAAHAHDLPERIRSLQRSGEQWLLFVDQFEELFTRSDERFRADFIETLLGLAQDAPGTIKLVLAMRADFLDRFSAYPRFAAQVEKNITLVAEMQADELRLAIEQPAAQHGVVFERGLVEEIIKDVQGQPGSLPLLQYTLDLLWEAERVTDGLADRHLNTRVYRELGGVRGALQKRADEIYAALGDRGEVKRANAKQEEVRRIFLRMVDIAGTGSDDAVWRPVRRRVAMSGFAGASEQELLQHLINQKLLVSSREGTEATVEVAHEALFTSWQRLRNWIEGGKQVIFVRNRLADDAQRWEQRQRSDRVAADEELLGGSRLSQALEMQARGDFTALVGGLTEIETQFLATSQTLRDRRLQEEKERQHRELVQAQALAAEQKQRADEQAKAAARQRKLTLGMMGVALATVLAALFAWAEKTKAQTANRIAVEKGREASHQLAEASWLVAQQARGLGAAESPTSPFQATHYLLRAATALQSTGASAATRDALLAAELSGPPIAMTLLQANDERPAGAIFSPNGKTILTWTEDGTARLWRSDDGQPVGNVIRQSGGIRGAVFSPDGQRILTWDFFGVNRELEVFEAHLWRIDGQPVGDPIKHGRMILGGTFSPDGERVLTWGMDGAARFWSATDGRPLGGPIHHGTISEDQDRQMEPIDGAAFGPNGQWVITWSVDREASPLFGRRLAKRGRARVWRVEDNHITEIPTHFSGTVVGVCIGPNDARLLTSSSVADNGKKFEVQQWALPTGTPLGAPISLDGDGFRARVSDDGQRLFAWGGPHSATLDGPTSASLWRTSDGQPVGQPILLHQGIVDARFSPDGERVLIWMHDQSKFGGKWKHEAQLWSSVDGRALEGVMNHEDEIRSASFSPDGQRVMTRSDDGTIRIWRTGQAVPVEGPADNVFGYARFNRDGTRLLAENGKGVARLLDTNTRAQVGPPLRPEMFGRGIADFSPDGTCLLVWNGAAEVQLWETQTAKPFGRPIQLGSVAQKGARDAIGALDAFATDSRHILTWNRDRGIQLWEAGDGSPVGQLIKPGGRFSSMQLSPDREQLLTWGMVGDGSVHFWRTRTGESSTLSLMKEGIAGAVFSPDGRHIVAWSFRGTITTLQASDHKILGTARHGHNLSGVAFSSDSERIVSWDSDGIVKAWWTSNLQPIGMPLLHPANVSGAMFSADNQRILSWSMEGAARLWSCENGQCIAIFRQPGGVAAACFNLAGTRVLTAGIEGAIRQWDITVDDNISVAERIKEFEVRTATTLGADGQVRILRTAEWEDRKIQLAEMRKSRSAR